MTTDFRALCAELLCELEHATHDEYQQDLKDRTRAALAEPQPESPTDEELMKLLPEDMHKEFACWSRIYAEQAGIKPGLFRVILNTHMVDFARAVLARWGRPTPQPVPVSERLPGPEDCDGEERCWMGYWDSHTNGLGHCHKTWFWTLEDLSMVDEYTHWLPAHTLPLPSGEVEK